jgi:hypothetical protein
LITYVDANGQSLPACLLDFPCYGFGLFSVQIRDHSDSTRRGILTSQLTTNALTSAGNEDDTLFHAEATGRGRDTGIEGSVGYGLFSHFGSWILLLEDHKPTEPDTAAWANYYHRNEPVSIGGIFEIS